MKDYPWHKHYPKAVSKEINPDAFASLGDLLDQAFTKYADQPAFVNMDKVFTFAEVDRLSAHFAAYLQQKLGLKKGDRIAIQMPNCLQYPVVMFGAIRAGLIVVNTNPLYTPREMEHQFKDSGVETIVIIANFACNLEKNYRQYLYQKCDCYPIGRLSRWAERNDSQFCCKKRQEACASL